MEASVTIKPEQGCQAFDNPARGLDPDILHRFIVGIDEGPQPMSAGEVAELGDPIATLVLAIGPAPKTPDELFKRLDDAVPADHPLGRATQMSFVLGEGSQVPVSEAPTLIRGIRFVVSRGNGPEGPDLLVSAAQPDGEFVEAMAWDEKAQGFNYYRTAAQGAAFVFGGNSSHAVSGPSVGKGPFGAHSGGNFLMKEFRIPWLHWHSFKANIFPSALAPQDPRRSHPWFTQKQGAETLELSVAKPAIERWSRARFAKVAADGKAAEAALVMRHVLATPTINLVTSQTESAAGLAGEDLDLPETFFVDSQALTEILGLEGPPQFTVSSAIYSQSLESLDFGLRGQLRDGRVFERPGDTHFAFVVPERAIEDNEALRQAIEVGLISKRFAACLLMVDFPNPLFSPRRTRLLDHCPDSASTSPNGAAFSEEMAGLIVAEADVAGPDSPEAEFAEHWNAGDGWEQRFGGMLKDYYRAVSEQLKSQQGFEDFVRLAEWRRSRVRETPLFENPLLFPKTNIDPRPRGMNPDGSVSPIEGV